MGAASSHEERTVQTMQQLGFTASEARAYVALLKRHPATGYEVAADSGVPRSAVYNVLRRLETLGLVNTIQAKPSRYVPLEPDRLSDLLQSRFAGTLEDLRGTLKELAVGMAPATTWTVKGYEAMLEQARHLIDSARRTIYLSLWRREALRLEEPLRRALAAGVEVVIFSFTPVPPDLGKVFTYGISEDDLGRYWNHRLICIADYREALVGGAEESQDNRAVVTSEFAILEMAVSNLILDITLLGERMKTDTHEVVTGLSLHLAPIDELLSARGKGNSPA